MIEGSSQPLEDAELEMVISVIRRGLSAGDKIQQLEDQAARLAFAIIEAKKRLKELNRIGQEVCRKYERDMNPNRKAPMTATEGMERIRWIEAKSQELKRQLE